MPQLGTIELPRTTVVPLAIAAARRAKIVASVAGLLAAMCLAFGAVDIIEKSTSPDRNDGAAIFWVAAFTFVCVLALRRAMRTTAAAKRAAADAGSTWTLVDKLVVAADDRGQPVLEHSFRITRGQGAALRADQTAAASGTKQSR